MLIDQIKKDSLVARKARETNKATLLTTLYSEAFMKGKNKNRESTDVEVVETVKKFIKNLNDTISNVQLSEQRQYEMECEIDIISVYLPKQLSEEELSVIIDNSIVDNKYSSMRDMGKIMRFLKEAYENQFDGVTANKIVRELLG